MMKKKVLSLVLLSCFLSCCVMNDGGVVCNPPYIRFADSCCIDLDGNSVCDQDEIPASSTTITTTTSSSTSTTSTSTSTTSTSSTSSTSTTLEFPDVYLSDFAVYSDDKSYTAFFYFHDSNNTEVPLPGEANLRIYDVGNNLVCERSFVVTKEGYRNLHIGLSEATHLIFTYSVPLSKVNYSTFEDGYAKMEFNISGSRYFDMVDREVRLFTFDEDNSEAVLEEKYLDEASLIGVMQKKNDLEVTVIRAGYYYVYHKGDLWPYLRFDVKVRNAGSKSMKFNAKNAVLIVDSIEYENYPGAFALESLSSGETDEGYLLFRGVPSLEGRTFDLVVGTSVEEEYHRVQHVFYGLAFAA